MCSTYKAIKSSLKIINTKKIAALKSSLKKRQVKLKQHLAVFVQINVLNSGINNKP